MPGRVPALLQVIKKKKKLPNEGKAYHNSPSTAGSRIIVIYGLSQFPISGSICIWTEEMTASFKLPVSTEWVDYQELQLLMAFGEFKTKLQDFFFISYLSEENFPWVFQFSDAIKHKDSNLKIHTGKPIKYIWLCQGLNEHTFVHVSFWWLCTYFHTGHMANLVNPRTQRGGTFPTR